MDKNTSNEYNFIKTEDGVNKLNNYQKNLKIALKNFSYLTKS